MNDITVVRSVIRWLGTLAVIGLVGIIALLILEIDPAAVALVAGLAGTAAGSLGTLLATTGTNQMPPQQVEVVNPADDPVPVDPA